MVKCKIRNFKPFRNYCHNNCKYYKEKKCKGIK